jgi:hypothetical protein
VEGEISLLKPGAAVFVIGLKKADDMITSAQPITASREPG